MSKLDWTDVNEALPGMHCGCLLRLIPKEAESPFMFLLGRMSARGWRFESLHQSDIHNEWDVTHWVEISEPGA